MSLCAWMALLLRSEDHIIAAFSIFIDLFSLFIYSFLWILEGGLWGACCVGCGLVESVLYTLYCLLILRHGENVHFFPIPLHAIKDWKKEISSMLTMPQKIKDGNCTLPTASFYSYFVFTLSCFYWEFGNIEYNYASYKIYV